MEPMVFAVCMAECTRRDGRWSATSVRVHASMARTGSAVDRGRPRWLLMYQIVVLVRKARSWSSSSTPPPVAVACIASDQDACDVPQWHLYMGICYLWSRRKGKRVGKQRIGVFSTRRKMTYSLFSMVSLCFSYYHT